MQIYSLLYIFQRLVQSIVRMTQASAASLEGPFRSLTDLAVRISFPVIFLLKVLLLNLVTYSFCRTVMRNRTVEIGHLFLTYSANSCYPILDGPALSCCPWCSSPHTLSGVWSIFNWDGPVGAYGLWRGQNGGISCTDTFPHLIFIVIKSLKF